MCSHTNIIAIVAAIFIIEGGNKTKFPYGIKSVQTDNPRQVCINTVRNNLIRWRKKGDDSCYLDFLADKYCPATSDRKGNINWKRNIRKYVK